MFGTYAVARGIWYPALRDPVKYKSKFVVLSLLRALRLNRIAAKVYYRTLHGFAPVGTDLPDAVERSFVTARTSGVLGQNDYCEFGVYKGYTFLHAQKVADKLGASDMRFIGFDSFEGLPEPEELDIVTDRHQPFYKGQYAASLEYVKNQLGRRGIDWGRSYLVPGYFDQTFAGDAVEKLNIDRVAVALVDCDLYSSTVDVLDFLETRLVDGAVVIMDDWKSYGGSDDRGQPLALKEFLERSPRWRCEHLFDYGDYGRVFSFHERA
jgi:hypothetical protein